MNGGFTFAAVLDGLAADPERVGIIDDTGPHTWASIRDEADAIARSLLASGVATGDVVACLMPNRVRWISCAVATTRIGAVFVPLNTWYTPRELRWTLRHTRARVLISEEEFLGHRWADELAELEPALASAARGDLHGAELPDLRAIVYPTGERPGAYDWAAFLDLGAAVTADAVEVRAAEVDADAPSVVLYTSGSTGTPKGVVLSQHRILANCRDNGVRRDIRAEDRIWLGSPLFWGLGATNVLPMAMMSGATLVIAERFDPEAALSAIETHRCTVYCGTSNMTRRIVEAPGFSRERVATLAKGNVGIGVAERTLLLDELGATRACTGYGVTELSGMCFVGDPDDSRELKLTTDGYLLPGFEAVIVDPETKAPLPAGEVGLLKVRGYTALGYLDNPAGNAEAFDSAGFYWTGDLGSVDADGRFRWRDRVKEMIKTGGVNVSPAEVEQLLLTHPAVTEAYVLGVPDRRQGEVPVAFVVTSARVEEAELRDHVAALAARFKVPTHVEFRIAEEIPRTSTGKVAKQALRAQWVQACAPSVRST